MLATGFVTKAFGNLLSVRFEGSIRQGEVAYVQLPTTRLKGEVIEIGGGHAKIQVYEDTRGIRRNTPVFFSGELLEAELGPGLLSSIVDGLQNPLEGVANETGMFLQRGVYLPSLDRTKHWSYQPTAKVGDIVERGDQLGMTMEGRFHHPIFVPFRLYDSYTLTWVIQPGLYTVDQVVARAVDSTGQEHNFTILQKWPIKTPLQCGEKKKPTNMMDTGSRIIDTQFPIMKGGTFCTPGPFGAGKTMLQHHLAKFASVDIVVMCACGERAGEVVEVLREFPHLTDPHTGDPLFHRTVLICNTSSMPVASREASIYLGITIAEYYRQMGLDVLLLADSTSRWAQALREMSGRLEEIPGEEAFPAYLSSRIAEFYERSGVLTFKDGKRGSVTIGGSVSPAGGNFEEPVTQATLSVVGAFLGLSRERSDARRYPAIDPLISWSKYTSEAGRLMEKSAPGWKGQVERSAQLLKKGEEVARRMEVVGEEGTSLADFIVYLKAELYDFSYLQQHAFDKEDAYCSLERQISHANLVNRILVKMYRFPTHELARKYFLALQNKVKNLLFLPFGGDVYNAAFADVSTYIEQGGNP